MATYGGGRRAPNVSQLLHDLNKVPDHSPEEEFVNYDEELARFTNTEFYDWDLSMDAGMSTRPAKMELETKPSTSPASPALAADLSSVDFAMQGEFNNYDFGFGASGVPAFADGLGNLQPLQPNPQQAYPQPGAAQSPYGVPQTPSEKRGSDASRALNFEDQSRVAAEEDKRRRNTAASARFRVKKKAREQALEKREKELADKVGHLEGRIHHLETENKWLRELVMEKTGGNDTIITTLLRDFKGGKIEDKKVTTSKPGTGGAEEA